MGPLAKTKSRVEIDLDAVKHNYREVQKKVKAEVKILGVVKADAYGLGAVEAGRVLEREGIEMLGVTNVAEGKELREAGISVPILVFGPFLQEEMRDIIDSNLTVTIGAREGLVFLRQVPAGINRKIKVHLKVETGFGRTGFWPGEVVEAACELKSMAGVELEGVYSHLATAMWREKGYAQSQFRLFKEAMDALEAAGFRDLIRHICNSAALIELPNMHLDMVRVGTVLFGQYPNAHLRESLSLRNPWTLKTRVVSLRELPPGHNVGYSKAYKTKHKTKVAVISLGFADGLQVEPMLKPSGFMELLKRMLKPLLQYLDIKRAAQPVFFEEGEGRVIGKAGMQLTMVDVSNVPGLKIGSWATVPVRRTAVSPLMPRVYFENGEIKSFREGRIITTEAKGLAAK